MTQPKWQLQTDQLKWWTDHKDAKIESPNYGDAGIDLRCVEDFEIAHNPTGLPLLVEYMPRNITKVDTHIHIEIPLGFVGIIKERSSMGGGKPSTNKMMQSPYGGVAVRGGVVDSSYRGAIIVALQNLTKHSQSFKAGDKIAQLVIVPYLMARSLTQVENLEDLSPTDRGSGGFGSTGR